MTAAVRSPAESVVRAAVATVDDPEYPGLSIADLGMVEDVRVDGHHAQVDLIPTFSGCPALAMIEADVRDAVLAVDGVDTATVTFVRTPVWTPERITDAGQAALAERFTVAVQLGSRSTRCPRCGTRTVEQSPFGPTRCRAVHRCPSCNEVVEVVR